MSDVDESMACIVAGQEVFRRAIEKMSESVRQLLEVNGMSLSDIDHLVPHQANLRIIVENGLKHSVLTSQFLKNLFT